MTKDLSTPQRTPASGESGTASNPTGSFFSRRDSDFCEIENSLNLLNENSDARAVILDESRLKSPGNGGGGGGGGHVGESLP